MDKGKRAERAVVSFLLNRGLGMARRVVRTGTATDPDEGDIRLPGVTIEVKHHAGGLSRLDVTTFLAKLSRTQCRPGDLGALVERVDRIADPGQWRVWLTMADLMRCVGAIRLTASSGHCVAMTLECFAELLIMVGWCDEMSDAVQALSEPLRASNPYL